MKESLNISVFPCIEQKKLSKNIDTINLIKYNIISFVVNIQRRTFLINFLSTISTGLFGVYGWKTIKPHTTSNYKYKEFECTLSPDDFEFLKSDINKTSSWWNNLLQVLLETDNLGTVRLESKSNQIVKFYFEKDINSERFKKFLNSFNNRVKKPINQISIVAGKDFKNTQKSSYKILVEESKKEHFKIAQFMANSLQTKNLDCEIIVKNYYDFWRNWNKEFLSVVDIKIQSTKYDFYKMVKSQYSRWNLNLNQPFLKV